MSDATVIDVDAPDSAAHAWLQALEREPDVALDQLLMGGVWLGGYASLGVAQALPQFLPERLLETVDGALQRWLVTQLKGSSLPNGATPKQYAQALAGAFALMQTVSLPLSQRWCREHATTLWGWVQGQPSFLSREPRSALLRALALVQPNRDLLRFWMSLCRQGHKPWVQLALFGLRRMPRDDEGTAESSLPVALVHGLLDYGQSLVRGGETRKKEWLAELDYLSAVYPATQATWTSRVREALGVRLTDSDDGALALDGSGRMREASGAHLRDGTSTLREWVGARLPGANQSSPRTGPVRKQLEPPHWKREIEPLRRRATIT